MTPRLFFGAALLALACQSKPATVPPEAASSTPTAASPDAATPADATTDDDAKARLAEILASPHRSEENRARDPYRHPAETLAFFGVKPEHTVIELWPGGGWYTEILAPYVKDRGELYVTIFDPEGPAAYYGTGQAKKMLDAIETQKDLFGHVKTIRIPQKVEIGKDGKVAKTELQPFELAPEGTADVVLTFRNSHGWVGKGVEEMVYGAAFKSLKKGGVFG